MNSYLDGYGRRIGDDWYYIGQWKDGNRHGQGKCVYFSDGRTEEGQWKDDSFIG